MNKLINQGQPRQRLPYKSKGKAWRRENVDRAERLSIYHNAGVRQTIENRIRNSMLYSGIPSMDDMAMALNPNEVDATYIPDRIPHHPIMAPKIDVLLGEEINRNFDYSFAVISPDAVSQKEEERKKIVEEALQELISQNAGPDEIKERLDKLSKYLKYTWQDSRERMVNLLMNYYYEYEEFDSKFNQGFKDVLLNGEEIYSCEVVGGEPKLEVLNGLKVRALRSGRSSRIEDSDMIIIEDHWSPGRIIDHFHEELKPTDIDYITGYTSSAGGDNYSDDQNNPNLYINTGTEEIESVFDSYQSIAELNGHSFSSNYSDELGNIRVLKLLWKSQKCVYKVKYYDELGEEQSRIESEEYIPLTEEGEEVTKLWINEWWEATKIGKELYVQMRPRPIQYVNLSNPSKCYPGIVGEVYNTNQGRAVSLVDKMKDYQYLYDAIWARLNKAIAKNLGKILLLDIAVVPKGWEPEKWIEQATNLGVGVVDGFKEGNRGPAQGKLAGNLNGATNTRAIDLETGNYIQQHISLLEFIKAEMGEIAGISRQREGQVANRESVGGVERAVTQSSHITEWLFYKHDQVKKRVLSTFLETAKYALRGRNKKVNYLLDDYTKQVINIDGDLINESEYGLLATDSHKVLKVRDAAENMAQAFMQNGGRFSTVLDIFNSPSMADMRNKIEQSEDEQAEREAAAAEQQAQVEAARMAFEEDKLNREDARHREDNLLKKYEIDANMLIKQEQLDLDSAKGDTSIERERLALDNKKAADDLLIKMKTLQQDWEKAKLDSNTKKSIAKSKPKPSSSN